MRSLPALPCGASAACTCQPTHCCAPKAQAPRRSFRPHSAHRQGLLGGRHTTPGTNIQLWKCNGSTNQKWTITESGQIKFGGPSSDSCATAFDGAVRIHDCNYPTYQEFEFLPGGEIKLKAFSDECMDATAPLDADYLDGQGVPSNGRNIQMFSCSEAQLNQKWNFSGQIHHSETGTCLDRRSSSSANGTTAQIWNCNSTSAQVWDYYFK